MRNFFKNHLNTILAAVGVVFAVVLAVISSLLTIDMTKQAFSPEVTKPSYISDTTTDDNSSLDSVLSTESIESEPPKPDIQLVLTSPSAQDITVKESVFAITGTSDPEYPLLLNGKEVSRLDSGEFSLDVTLSPGKNTFKFEHKGKTRVYIIRYNFVVIKSFSPSKKQEYEAGSSFVAVAVARADCSSVKATFNGKTIRLTPADNEKGEEFIRYTGTFTLPKGNKKNKNLGSVKFTAVCNGVKKSHASNSIICLRDASLVGKQIVKIVASQAETFNGNTTDDWSRPTNSYLPAGTIDYKVGSIVYEPESGNSYYNLRCGKRVYITKKNAPEKNKVRVSKLYEGKLPKYNDITFSSFENGDKHSTLTIDTKWKAPFAVKIGPQEYDNPAKQDYEILKATYKFVDIKFFYTKDLEKLTIPDNNPIFSSSKIIKGEDGYTLRLYLKSVGAFYGWNAEYNKSGQLVFSFLNPPVVTKRNDLTGIKIVIDVGHGGIDIGAPGLRPKTMCEAERNLALALKLKTQLEKYGATVVMTRTTNKTLSADARCEFLRKEAPDLCIAIHHDSSTRSSASGGSIFCFNAFSDRATKIVTKHTSAGKFYNRVIKGWHYFYLCRVTSCPVVLTENGFISNPGDFNGIRSEAVNLRKAKAITAGVLEYFNSFYKTVAKDDQLSYNDTDTSDITDTSDDTGSSKPPKPDTDQSGDIGGETTPNEDEDASLDEDTSHEEDPSSNENSGTESETESIPETILPPTDSSTPESDENASNENDDNSSKDNSSLESDADGDVSGEPIQTDKK